MTLIKSILGGVEKFYGHNVIEDNDSESALGYDVLELTRDETFVITHHYDDGREVVLCKIEKLKNPSDNILKGIQKQFGSKNFLISQSARDHILFLENY